MQLETPADRRAGGLGGDQGRGQGHEGGQHPGEEGQGLRPGARTVPGMGRQSQRLHRQDREHAGHQVQHHPAQKGEGKGQGQAEAAAGRAGRRSQPRRRGGQGARMGSHLIGLAVHLQHALQRLGGRRLGEVDARIQRQRQAMRAALEALRRRVLDDSGGVGEEIGAGDGGPIQGRAGHGQLQPPALQGRHRLQA